MENLSIKILDALFDLCEGENYVILDKEDIVASFPEHSFETDELTEILESLTVEGFIDLKYADNTEYCVAMRTKGRTLIKQSREKLQSILRDNVVASGEDDVIEAEGGTSPVEAAYRAVEDTIPPAFARTSERRTSHRRVQAPLSSEEGGYSISDGNYPDRGKLSRGFDAMPERDEAVQKAAKVRERRVFLAAMIGSAVGSIVMDLIFLVVFLIKLKS